jgi:L-ribulose-5-phosphate 4-epimerase
MEEGYTKFNSTWISVELFQDIEKLNEWREKLRSLELIGMRDGIGYGNISIRKYDGFVISGTKTGGIEKLTEANYTKVLVWDYDKNWLACVGKIDASSESLSHAAVYQSDKNANAVIHIHSLKLWESLINKIPTTSPEAEYGTPEIARDIIRLFKETDVKEKKILVMGGHREGIISFGKDLDEAGNVLLRYL